MNTNEMDDVPTDAEIAEGTERGDEITSDLLTQCEEAESDHEHNVMSMALYGVWCNLTQYLVQCGWTTDELVRDVTHHAELGQSEGRA